MKELTVEERRLERLRNLLSPFYNLPQFIKENENGRLDKFIEKSADGVLEVLPFITEALRSDITLVELGQLYTDPENRRPNLNGVTIECANDLVEAIEDNLHTKELQTEFLETEYPDLFPNIDLDGPLSVVAYNIFVEFSNNNMLGSLIATMNGVLKADLYLIIEKNEAEEKAN